MLAGVWPAIRNWATERPADVDDRLARIHVLARVGFPNAVMVHAAFVVIFWYLEIWPLMIFNIFSVALWAGATWWVVVHNVLHRPLFYLCQFVEVPVHGVIATIYLGLAPGFFFYPLLTILITSILTFVSRPLRAALCVVFIVSLAACGAYVNAVGPVAPQSATFDAVLFAINAVMFSSLLAMLLGVFEWLEEVSEAELVESRRRLEAVSAHLAKYVSPQLYQAILSGKQESRVVSRRRKLTVFFSDVVGFTETAERMESEGLTELLNEYLTEMSKIAQAHGANFDKFIGDAIVLYFGDPDTLGPEGDALRCVEMACAMQERMGELQRRWKAKGLEHPFRIRIGINTGYCTVGNFGSDERMDYTIIGRQVNLTARLQAAAEPGQILLAHETWALVSDRVAAEPGETVTMKGIAHPVRTYRVVTGVPHQPPVIALDTPGISLRLDPGGMDEAARVEAAATLRAALGALEER
ncbi:adenylate/guanylate cyclase domain-containing protein [Ruegeria marina]|uniref:Adenylate cyclase, class 3 n=1 Tax=Ruegeria marina TaxID=639004 RepID=A0A1G6P544_9RHOB|nr:adenylate/guanylate cyclase domain-containing protein [Ruegeria marina]SDC74616.1 Adenylate cyclase, class 3 [Ruegeria marina]